MNPLTHQQAQRFLHDQADHALTAQDTIALQTHLTTCPVCQAYATELTILEKRVRRVLHAHWPAYSTPLTNPLIAVQTQARKPPMYKTSPRFANALFLTLLLLTLAGILTFFAPNPTQLPATQLIPSETAIETPSPTAQTPLVEDNKFPILQTHIVKEGDTLWSIAETFGLQPETILFANEDQLADDVHNLFPGFELLIPPVDGLIYTWQTGDTLDKVAAMFNAQVEDIIEYPGNALDSPDSIISPGTRIMIPGGSRDLRIWTIPDATRDFPQALRTYGPGACLTPSEGLVGTGVFVWPTDLHALSGYDYSSLHSGIDLAVTLGSNIYAADSGVIVFAGWSNMGYGNLIILDHDNGYLTAYAHLNKVLAHCGDSVAAGQIIAQAGETGNATGPNLHFEVHYNGEVINPWTVLPPP